MTFSVSRDVEWSEKIVEIFLYAIRYYDYCHYFYCTTILLRRMDALFSEIPAQPMISHSQSTGVGLNYTSISKSISICQFRLLCRK